MANEALNSIDFDQAGDFDPSFNQQAQPSPPTPAPIPTDPAAICADDTSGSEYCYAGAGYGLRQSRNLGTDGIDHQFRDAVLNGTIPSAIADAGASSNVGKYDDCKPMMSDCGEFSLINNAHDLTSKSFIKTGQKSSKIFSMPMGHKAQADEVRLLQHKLREPARSVDMVPGIHNSLLSTGKFADANYISIFDKDEVNIYDATNTVITVSRGAILRGWRDNAIGLWRIPLVSDVQNFNTETTLSNLSPQELLATSPPPPPLANPEETINNVYELKTTPELIRYYHAAAGFPTQPTWIKAIKNNQFASWPGLRVDAARKHFPESTETWKGHGRKIKSGLRSTRQIAIEEEAEAVTKQPTKKQRTTFATTYDLHDEMERKSYSDQTGRFPVRSYRGHQYIMILLEVDSDAILAEPLKNRTSGELTKAYKTIMDRLHKCGIKPTLHILDNECSGEFKDAISSYGAKHQLVPPHDHRRNIAEKAIQVFKDHFVSVLCGTAEDFPMNLWCRLIRQAEHQLNMLRTSNVTPTMSSFAQLHGQHNYDANPFAPLGAAVEMHVMPAARPTWGEHTKSGFYIGTSWEHYRCHSVYLPETKGVRVAQTVFFKHRYLTQPTITDTDAILLASDNLCAAIKGVAPDNSATKAAVAHLIDIFKKQAAAAKTPVDDQRVSRVEAQQQRVATEASNTEDDVWANPDEPRLEDGDIGTSSPLFVEYPTTTAETARHANIISQDEDDADLPTGMQTRRSTRQQRLLNILDVANTPLSARATSARKYPLQFLTEYANAVLDDDTGELLEYRHLVKRPKYKTDWEYSLGNEIGRLCKGMPGRNDGTETMEFIYQDQVPKDRWKDMTNIRLVCNVRPQKSEVNRTRCTVDGSRTNFVGDVSTPTANLLTVKLLFNSIISTPGARFLGLDLKDFYLNTPMDRPEYVRMKLSLFPDDVVAHYNLREKASPDGTVYVKIVKGMYGLPQAGLIAQELLEKRLALHGYRQSTMTPGFWKHDTRPISFSLIVDDFGVKYVGKEHADHLISVLKEHYTVDEDWEGKKYCGITLDWDYVNREVHLSMPGYCDEALVRFRHKLKKVMDQPHKHTVPVYGSTIQYAKPEDTTELLDKAGKLFIQQVTGTFLYYARAVDGSMLVALSAIATAQASPTEATMVKTKLFLDYVASHPDAVLSFKASSMTLAIHSDASYLSESKARSRAGGHFFMSNNAANPPNNGAVLNILQIIKSVMSSAAEAELGALFINSKQAVPARTTLEEMGHPQPPTPIQTDNSTAIGVVNKKNQMKQTKSMDMRFHWMRDRETKKQFRYYWGPGKDNLADYWTKHFCAAHHREIRPTFLTPSRIVNALREKNNLPPHVFRASERVC